jgi:hypothetical protein
VPIIQESELEDGYSPPPNDNGQVPPESESAIGPDFTLIFGAQDFTTLIRRPQTQKGREYTGRIASAFKAYAIGAMQSGNFPDAATILYHGPGAATAMGDLCATNEWAAKTVDLLTSPNSPVVATMLTVMPLISQLLRNHEQQIEQIPARFDMSKQARAERKQRKSESKHAEDKPLFTIRLGKRSIPVRLKLHRKPIIGGFIKGVRAQTADPNMLAHRVFTDPDVLRQLQKMGILVHPGNNTDG